MEFEVHLGLVEERAQALHGVSHERVELQPLALKLDLASRDASRIEQVVEQPGEMIDLFVDGSLRPLRLLTCRGCAAQEVQAVLDGSQRVSQLVRKRCQKLVLA